MRATSPVPLPVTGIRLSLWRALSVFRFATLVICLFLIIRWRPIYDRPEVALAVGGVMAVVTGIVVVLGWTGRAHRWSVVGIDIVITAALTMATVLAQTDAQEHGGMVTLTTIWAAGPAIGAAFLAGPLGGVIGAVIQAAAAFVARGAYSGETLYSGILLLVTGATVGLVVRYSLRAEDELRVAAAAQAAVAERERLARSIHDGVLQVLGLVHRTGRDEGGRWAAIAEAAAEQEAALRGLISSRPRQASDVAVRDLADELRALRSATVTVSAPGEPVPLLEPASTELADAVRAALQNVTVHAGDDARAWVLLEIVDREVRVTVRDDGAGMAPDRLREAEADGRIGVARSIRGRVEGLGGRCTIMSTPGEGTEIEMAVPIR